jgi:hypothetical protein
VKLSQKRKKKKMAGCVGKTKEPEKKINNGRRDGLRGWVRETKEKNNKIIKKIRRWRRQAWISKHFCFEKCGWISKFEKCGRRQAWISKRVAEFFFFFLIII